MKSLSFDRTNLACGLIFIGFGLFFAIQSLGMQIGTAFRMGPGYFPLVLACILVILGAVIVVGSATAEGEPLGPIAWRGMLLILPAPVFFGLTVRGLGFVPALFCTALIASFASRRMSLAKALVLSALLTAFSVAVFSYGLGLPFQRFGPWTRW
ncbi:tripartite tricarboxylate transporter TctB family protein [Aquamicrobium sp. LC103]|uniref:tripartite tricarboxylate transporter TctB family protein n=1 Tax=Aquamicrobium sp. LC103 TaxID=1120658 RepID=UPI00063E7321|nr:tripartite tricarboxylate transporter TctB family protein [Aquamicrobium sp. LC103]TKT79063.1 tripartite tricarboxylate transporter TctB family protein [Aquamicrobium sp. LC103]